MARLTKQQIADIAAAETKAAQQAELKRLRAEKAAATRAANKATKAKLDAQAAAPAPVILLGMSEAKVDEVKPEFTEDEARKLRQEKLASTLDELLAEMAYPSWKRVMAASVVGMIAACGVGYLVGMVAAYIVAGILAYTGLAWLAWVVYVLSILIGMIAGGRVGTAAFAFIADKRLDAQVTMVKDTMKLGVSKLGSLFKAKEIEQFSGAHQA